MSTTITNGSNGDVTEYDLVVVGLRNWFLNEFYKQQTDVLQGFFLHELQNNPKIKVS